MPTCLQSSFLPITKVVQVWRRLESNIMPKSFEKEQELSLLIMKKKKLSFQQIEHRFYYFFFVERLRNRIEGESSILE